MINIITGFPPNIKRIEKEFGELPSNVVFAYGNAIFNPSGIPVNEPLRIHELTHLAQQGDDPDAWWDKYISDKKFRFEQELEAFSNEYNCFRGFMKDRNKVANFLHSVATRLSSNLYSSDKTYSECVTLIRQHADSGHTKRR
jgi:hypothetical protein